MSEKKFSDPITTAEGKKRAWVDLNGLDTLWLNTGTLCNLTCKNCYIESSPTNDSLVYLKLDEVIDLLDEIKTLNLSTKEIGITGGEPFLNPDIISIVEEILSRGFKLLLLTNAMRPMMKVSEKFLEIKNTYSELLTVRVSVDHYTEELHQDERGRKSWQPMIDGLKWLSDNDFRIDIGGRTRWGEKEDDLRVGYSKLFEKHNIKLDAYNKKELLLFPEMDTNSEVPEISTDCWKTLNVDPDDMMCATSRMVVKRKGDDKPSVMACTLLPYDQQFNLGSTLKEASKSVYLNHPHCSKFCVLGGGSCSIND